MLMANFFFVSVRELPSSPRVSSCFGWNFRISNFCRNCHTMSKDLHASMRAAAKLSAEDTDEMDNTHTVVRAAYAARVQDEENC